MKLFYVTGDDRKELCEADTREEIDKFMYQYLKEVLKFTSYYQREWNVPPDETYIDYGSHTEFFVIKK